MIFHFVLMAVQVLSRPTGEPVCVLDIGDESQEIYQKIETGATYKDPDGNIWTCTVSRVDE